MVAAAARAVLTTAVLVAVVGAPMLLVLAPAAHACSCAVGPGQPDALLDSDVVFEGRAVDRDGDTWTFDVDRAYRGPVTAQQRVVTARDSASCGASLTLGEPYLIDGRTDRDEPRTVRTGLCSMTQSTTAWTAADRQQVVQRLGPGAAPPRSTAPPVPGPGVSGGVAVVVVSGVLLGAALVVVTAVALRRRR